MIITINSSKIMDSKAQTPNMGRFLFSLQSLSDFKQSGDKQK